ncbi:hypothetical protein FHW16_004027 [Phyllobacterium myrsinacearum]|uniref:Uncharacterized protein n=1 Tax=Phyllobacterium myrsinacearum TaxID=28101 RepID=A0A839EV51_9HYPH|nr:hypothetical protein [Phyllobacterium myrsinacearum]
MIFTPLYPVALPGRATGLARLRPPARGEISLHDCLRIICNFENSAKSLMSM